MEMVEMEKGKAKKNFLK